MRIERKTKTKMIWNMEGSAYSVLSRNAPNVVENLKRDTCMQVAASIGTRRGTRFLVAWERV